MAAWEDEQLRPPRGLLSYDSFLLYAHRQAFEEWPERMSSSDLLAINKRDFGAIADARNRYAVGKRERERLGDEARRMAQGGG